jgi:hypothetical protein
LYGRKYFCRIVVQCCFVQGDPALVLAIPPGTMLLLPLSEEFHYVRVRCDLYPSHPFTGVVFVTSCIGILRAVGVASLASLSGNLLPRSRWQAGDAEDGSLSLYFSEFVCRPVVD